jgi:hypothetical protein
VAGRGHRLNENGDREMKKIEIVKKNMQKMQPQTNHKNQLYYTHTSIAEGAGAIRLTHLLGRNTVVSLYPYHLTQLRTYIDNIYTYAIANRSALHYYSEYDRKNFTNLYFELYRNSKLSII